MEAFILVLHITAFGYSASVLPEPPKFRVAYGSEAECRKDIPALRRAVSIPSIATLDFIECRKLEIRK